jgi:hypothetical protein
MLTLPGHHAKFAARILMGLECLLQLTSQTVPRRPSAPAVQKILLSLLGAINSPKFFDGRTRGTVYAWSNAIIAAINSFREARGMEPLAIKASKHVPQPEIEVLVKEFESRTLDDETVWIWSVWQATNSAGKVTYLPLYPFYRRFGRESQSVCP